MKKTICALLCLCLFLTACQKQPVQTEPSTIPTAEPTTEVTTAPTTEPTTAPTTEPTTVPTTEPPVLYRHPLTGEPLDAPFTVRPVAVSSNNYKAAQPVLGISHADIIFEHITEALGGETRMLAVYTDLDYDDRLGTVRSARTYSVDLASGLNALFVHCGGSDMALNQISRTRYPSLDEIPNGQYFYRDQDRLGAGYSKEHTLVTEGRKLLKAFADKKMDLTAPEDAYYGFTFSDEADLNGSPAANVTIQYYNKNGKFSNFEYDKAEGMYYGVQKWSNKQISILDGNTDDLIPFKNILILKTKVTFDADGYHVYMKLTGEGEGFLVRDGQYVPIKWQRDAATDPFTFTLSDGSVATFGVGKTYVSILPSVSPDVIFE